MKKETNKYIALFIFLIFLVFLGLVGTAIILTHKATSNRKTYDKTESTPTNLFYQYSDADNTFSWNLYNDEKASFDAAETGYLYYVFNDENENNKQNQLLIAMSDFSFWFQEDLKFTADISNGKATEQELDLGSDLRNNWDDGNTEYPVSDITNKFNIERKVTLKTSHTDERDHTEYYTQEYNSPYMDIYVNSNNNIVYALPEDIRTISYVTKDEVNTDAVQGNETLLEGNKFSNIKNIIDSLEEPNYAIVTNSSKTTKLTYVWYIFDKYYFYYTMSEDYYLDGMFLPDEEIKAPLTGSDISDFEYGIVNKNYVYYTNNELARLFDAKEKRYNTETWISIKE